MIGMMMSCTINATVTNTPSDYVDPNIGTAHCRWFFYTPAALPFGMAKVAPSTNGHLGNKSGWEAVGYDFRHTSIEGFANFHEFQIGGVVIAPTVGKLHTEPGELDNPDGGYRSRFDKKDEVAKPGYYSVLLKDYNIKAELTATKRVGFHRYIFPKTQQANLIFDIGNKQGESGDVTDAAVRYYDDGRVEGYVVTSPMYVNTYQKGADVRMYFSAVVDKKPSCVGTFIKRDISPNRHEAKGPGAGLYLTFSTNDNEAIQIKVGLSYTSIENARFNRESEAKSLDFDKAKSNAIKTWNEALGRISVQGGKQSDKVKFYTGLFHALLGRGLASDANGYYPKNDGMVGRISLDAKGNPLHNHYNTDAIWGAYWNLTQLWALAYPEYYSDWVSSQLLVYKDAGWLGDGIACSKYVSGVGTNFVGLAIAAAYNCGIRDFDVQLGYEAALKNEIEWRDRPEGAGKTDVRQFVQRGYSPWEKRFGMGTSDEGSAFGASHTMEYSFSCYAVAQLAKMLGKDADYQLLNRLSYGWKNLFDTKTRLIRPKDSNGCFISDFNPLAPWVGFQEGNAVQYTFYVPQHIGELVDLIGKDAFNNRLDSIFLLSQKSVFGGGTEIDAFSGLHTVYNHGNQPNLHVSWLFNFSGKPWLSQKWVRAILDEFYGVEGIHGYGYGQDEDQGQLGAWYVMSALGLFDVKGLTGPTPTFQIGTPLFDKITIRLSKKYYSGKTFEIDTRRSSTDQRYLQRIRLNGKPFNTVQLPFTEIVKGGRLTLDAGSQPNEKMTY
uniref:GH92 family glycosyl hydrolase n=1 Tax=Prevotella sp. TaxID=59823 RepID=UPI0040260337